VAPNATKELVAEGGRDTEWAIIQAERFLDAGAYMIMVEDVRGIAGAVFIKMAPLIQHLHEQMIGRAG